MLNGSLAPGWPGIPPRWTSSAKTGVGTALNQASRVWFTLSHGIFDEIYYPREDQALYTRYGPDHQLSGMDFFSEEKRQTGQQIEALAPGVPAFKLTNTCLAGRYRIEKEILADPKRDVVLQNHSFHSAAGQAGGLSPVCRTGPTPGQMRVPITPPGSVAIKVCRCSSPNGKARHWHWPVPHAG